MDGGRLSDSSYFFSERRLSQLFNVDAWTTDNEDASLDDEDRREPPPEPAPRGSYCPPSPGTAHAPSHPQTNIPYGSFSPHHQIAKDARGSHPQTNFSDDMALGMSRLSKLSSGSNLTGEEEDERHDGRITFRYSRSSTVGDDVSRYSRGSNVGENMTPTPGSPASCQAGSNRFSGLSQLTGESKSNRGSRASSSLPSVLSDLVREGTSTNDLFEESDEVGVLTGVHPWGEVINDSSDINWQERCLELELSLQSFRDQAGKIRDLLREKRIGLLCL